MSDNILSIAIQHNAKYQHRLENIKAMKKKLDDRRVMVIVDTKEDLWDSCKRALLCGNPNTTHALVMQDDIEICEDFIETVQLLIDKMPNEIITFFSNRKELTQAKHQDKPFLKLKRWLMAQCYVVPIKIAKDFIEWSDKNVDPRIYFDDARWAVYCMAHERFVYATAPSLVQHTGWNETTLTNYPRERVFDQKFRTSPFYIGAENTGLYIDWDKNRNIVVDNGFLLLYNKFLLNGVSYKK